MRVRSCPGKCSKVFILLVNIVIFLVGGGCLGLGIYYHMEGGLYEYVLLFKDAEVITVPVVLMFLGCLFVTISFFAIIGALCEVVVMLKIYMGIIAIVLLLEVILMGVCIAMRGEAERRTIAMMHNLMEHYGNEDTDNLNIITKTIDQTQEWLSCCGLIGPADWTSSTTAKYWAETYNSGQNDPPILPASCCLDTSSSANCALDTTEGQTVHHSIGCAEQLDTFVDNNVTYITVVGIVLIILQAFILIGALKIRFELDSKYDGDDYVGGSNMEITSL